ncbi:axl1p [Saccharomyces arboricola H-6]|uniref:Axl1p n=1 Tax=Saccharomyces arboricola (strain H-6 / AS 2.3317 / CBS 10644) TaxID=1160507 RepID=J8LGV2_SACAR|nr:axl1p [Saccharomyces arboricola H-6]
MSLREVINYEIPFYIPLSYGNRTHKICKLPNGILALLISDPTDTSSSCSLSVCTGSHNDPKDIPGLAHLCEHMILAAGSKKYPDPGLFHTLIAKNNGSQNAFTTGEQTTFYFELPNTQSNGEFAFESILDVFASFFKEPLFNPLLISKEIYAIQSEHEGNISSTTKIFYHAARLLANSNHPFSRFSTGNIHSLSSIPQLKKINLKNSLNAYFKNNFFGENITLCIRGSQSVNILAKLAISKFGDIKPKNNTKESKFLIKTGSFRKSQTLRRSQDSFKNEFRKLETFKILDTVWEEKYKNTKCFEDASNYNTIFINSNKAPIIRFLFPVSAKNTRFTKEDINIYSHLWCELFGDESPGSLSCYLVSKGWITKCFAFISEFAVGDIGLMLELELTNSGWERIESITKTLFSKLLPSFYVKNIDYLITFLKEQNLIDIARFLYQSSEDLPMEECSNLSGILQENLECLTPSNVFKGFKSLIEIDHPSIEKYEKTEASMQWWTGQAIKFQNFLKSFMNHENVRLLLLGDIKSYNVFDKIENRSEMHTEFFYEFEYYTAKVPLVENDRFHSKSSYEFNFPTSNLFLPDYVNDPLKLQQLFLECALKSKFATLRPQIQSEPTKKLPQLVSKNLNYEMWVVKEDPDYASDNKSVVSFEVLGLGIKPSPEATIHLEVLAQVLFITTSSFLYPALRVGYTYEVASSSKGNVTLRFTISGFPEGVFTITKAFVDTLKQMATDPLFPSKDTLRKARILVRSKYESASSDNCVKLASIGLLIVLEEYMWTLQDRIDALELTEMESFKKFCYLFWKNPKKLVLLVQGNIQYADEINQYLNNNFTQHLKVSNEGSRPTIFLYPLPGTKILHRGTNAFISYKGHQDDPNNSIVYFIETAQRDDNRNLTLTFLTEYLFSLTLVPDLRNKKQIGYIVLGGLRVLTDTIGIHITVMSGNSAHSLETKINEYLSYLQLQVLNSLTESDFRRMLLEPFLTLLKQNNINNLQALSGPANLLNEIVANVQNGDNYAINNRQMKQHRRIRNKIAEKRLHFQEEYEMVDIPFLQKLTLRKYLEFFESKISIYSKQRSKLSIMITSPMAEEEIVSRKIFLQLEAFLKMKGFAIKNEDLKKIVEQSKGSPVLLIKTLFNHFRRRNEAFKLSAVILKEISKIIALNIKQRYGSGLNFSSHNSERQDIEKFWKTDIKPIIPLQELPGPNVFRPYVY